jgi:hypothetical protein
MTPARVNIDTDRVIERYQDPQTESCQLPNFAHFPVCCGDDVWELGLYGWLLCGIVLGSTFLWCPLQSRLLLSLPPPALHIHHVIFFLIIFFCQYT